MTPAGPHHFLANQDPLLVTLLIAALVHALLILGIHFASPPPPKPTRASMDVTLVMAPAPSPPTKPQHLAAANQAGAGEAKKSPSPAAAQLAQPLPGHGVRTVRHHPVEASPKPAPKVVHQRQAAPDDPVSVEPHPPAEQRQAARQPLSPEALRQQIAQLGTEVGFGHPGADEGQTEFVNLASAKEYAAAQYLKDWEAKVERTGNLNFPEMALKKGHSSSLTLDVGLRTDGNVHSIGVRKSSGNPALDEAAKKIVRLSAPFPPLPIDVIKALKLSQNDVLVISRVWIFSDEAGVSTH